MTMTTMQSVITIGIVVAGTMLTRYLAFLLFPGKQSPPAIIRYLGQVLPYAVIGMLIIYCLKDVSLIQAAHGIPEGIAIALIMVLHKWKRNMLLSIAGGTIAYMVLVQYVFA